MSASGALAQLLGAEAEDVARARAFVQRRAPNVMAHEDPRVPDLTHWLAERWGLARAEARAIACSVVAGRVAHCAVLSWRNGVSALGYASRPWPTLNRETADPGWQIVSGAAVLEGIA